MNTLREEGPRGRKIPKPRTAFAGGLLFAVSLCSCTSVKFDLRDIAHHPVTMNSNPFACDRSVRPVMTPVDGYDAKVHDGFVAVPLLAVFGVPAPIWGSHLDEARDKAMEKIGGKRFLAITDARLRTHSWGYVLFILAMGADVNVAATGTVQEISGQVEIEAEDEP